MTARLTPEREAFIREVYGWSNQSPISEVFRELDAVRRERDAARDGYIVEKALRETRDEQLDEARKAIVRAMSLIDNAMGDTDPDDDDDPLLLACQALASVAMAKDGDA